MDIYHIIVVLIIGLSAGILSGLFGVGGGIIVVPALIFLLGYSQKMAQGTTLLMLMLPVVALGVLKYYEAGNISWKTALILGIGFVPGGYLGGKIVNSIPEVIRLGNYQVYEPVKKLFALLILFVGFKMLFGK